jgi:serine/threonine-protein kinase
MAEVFLASARGDDGSERLVVVKRLYGTQRDDVDLRRMFKDEARLALQLDHPNIVTAYEAGEMDGDLYLSMEKLDGRSLEQVFHKCFDLAESRRPLPLGVVGRIVSDLLAGLAHAHSLRSQDGIPLAVVHRDVSPGNVFVTYDGVTKVLDFGVAKWTDAVHRTAIGQVKGKLAYMAPEQARAERVDARADLFATGLVAWELLAQRRLQDRAREINVLYNKLFQPVASLREARPDVPEEIAGAVHRALATAPADRYPDAKLFRAAWDFAFGRTMATAEEVAIWMRETFAEERAKESARTRKALAAVPALAHLAHTGEGSDPPPSAAARQSSDPILASVWVERQPLPSLHPSERPVVTDHKAIALRTGEPGMGILRRGVLWASAVAFGAVAMWVGFEAAKGRTPRPAAQPAASPAAPELGTRAVPASDAGPPPR